MTDEQARLEFLRAARRQHLDADVFAGDMIAFFRGTSKEAEARRLADQVAGSATDAATIAHSLKRRDDELDEEMRLCRERAERFVQQWMRLPKSDRT